MVRPSQYVPSGKGEDPTASVTAVWCICEIGSANAPIVTAPYALELVEDAVVLVQVAELAA